MSTDLSAPDISLSEPERLSLEQLLRRSSTPQHIALRAKIILRSSSGERSSEISRGLSISFPTIRLWRRRWIDSSDSQLSVEERLKDSARQDWPSKFSLEEIIQLYALASDPPEKHGLSIRKWNARKLATQMVEQGIVESISVRHVRRLLKDVHPKMHQSDPK